MEAASQGEWRGSEIIINMSIRLRRSSNASFRSQRVDDSSSECLDSRGRFLIRPPTNTCESQIRVFSCRA